MSTRSFRRGASGAVVRPLGLVMLLVLGVNGAHPARAEGDPARGAKAFQVCAACHSLRLDLDKTGPSLAGVWGRKAGGLASFDRYSPALKASGVVWDGKTLDPWLKNPEQLIPGNRMVFDGIPDAQTRADLIAFLHAVSETRDGKPAVAVPSAYIEPPKDLKHLSPDRQVKAIRSCRDSYYVTTADGRLHAFWDESLRLETDASAFGPASGTPVILQSGMFGDRAVVIFAAPEDISPFIKHQC